MGLQVLHLLFQFLVRSAQALQLPLRGAEILFRVTLQGFAERLQLRDARNKRIALLGQLAHGLRAGLGLPCPHAFIQLEFEFLDALGERLLRGRGRLVRSALRLLFSGISQVHLLGGDDVRLLADLAAFDQGFGCGAVEGAAQIAVPIVHIPLHLEKIERDGRGPFFPVCRDIVAGQDTPLFSPDNKPLGRHGAEYGIPAGSQEPLVRLVL